MSIDELCAMSLAEAAEAIRTKRISPVELTRACLQRIVDEDGLINSFVAVFAEDALAAASTSEREITNGHWRGPLHGIPIAVKDLIDMQGKVTTAGSAVFRDNIANDDAAVVKRLHQAGGVILGKNNLHEFAYGGSGVISRCGPARNPRDIERITGGSSSGSAAAVAAEHCFAAIGTDTAGSIRLPAACCGIVGLKPSYGRVSAHGVVPLSWSYDHVGPLARTVEDASLVLQAISDWRPEPVDVAALRVGVARDYFFEGLEPQVANACESAIELLSRVCASVREIRMMVDEDRTVSSAEAWQFHKQWIETKAELYQPQTLVRIRSGERYTPEQIEAKRKDLERMRGSAVDLFRDVDVIVTPTCPILPPKLEEVQAHPETLRPKELIMLRNTRPWNVLGIPAISVPCGPMVGIQLAALQENTLIALGETISGEIR